MRPKGRRLQEGHLKELESVVIIRNSVNGLSPLNCYSLCNLVNLCSHFSFSYFLRLSRNSTQAHTHPQKQTSKYAVFSSPRSRNLSSHVANVYGRGKKAPGSQVVVIQYDLPASSFRPRTQRPADANGPQEDARWCSSSILPFPHTSTGIASRPSNRAFPVQGRTATHRLCDFQDPKEVSGDHSSPAFRSAPRNGNSEERRLVPDASADVPGLLTPSCCQSSDTGSGNQPSFRRGATTDDSVSCTRPVLPPDHQFFFSIPTGNSSPPSHA